MKNKLKENRNAIEQYVLNHHSKTHFIVQYVAEKLCLTEGQVEDGFRQLNLKGIIGPVRDFWFKGPGRITHWVFESKYIEKHRKHEKNSNEDNIL